MGYGAASRSASIAKTRLRLQERSPPPQKQTLIKPLLFPHKFSAHPKSLRRSENQGICGGPYGLKGLRSISILHSIFAKSRTWDLGKSNDGTVVG